MNDEMETTRSGIGPPPERPNIGSIATPGNGSRVSAGILDKPEPTSSGKGGRPATNNSAEAARKRAAYAKAKANGSRPGANQGKAAPKTAAKGGGSTRPAASPRQTAPDIPKLVVETPREVNIGGDVPKLEILPTLQAVLQFGADSYSMSRPLVDLTMFPEQQMELSIGKVSSHNPNVLRALWKFTPTEIDTVAIPLANMIPELPPKYLRVVEKSMNPLALIAGLFALIVPRMQNERMILDAVRQFNAGFQTQTAQPQSGQNTGNPAANGNGATPPDTRVHDIPPNPYAGSG